MRANGEFVKTKRLRIINREKGSKPESDAQVPTGNSAPVVVSDYYEPFPRQNEFHLSKAKYRLFGGAAGPGKTKALLWEAIRQAHGISGGRYASSAAYVSGT